MILLLAATEREMDALRRLPSFIALLKRYPGRIDLLVTGVGIVETTLSLSRYLENHKPEPWGLLVLQFGVGGAYRVSGGPGMLDLCVAEKEIFGDLGVCLGVAVQYLDERLTGSVEEYVDEGASNRIFSMLKRNGTDVFLGNFVTVQAVTGTLQRGDFLCRRWKSICENMEGAAAAKVSARYKQPFAEIRAISNMIEERNPRNWMIDEACDKVAAVIPSLVDSLFNPPITGSEK